MTYLPTYGHLTSRDTCVSKNDEDEEDTVGGSKGGCGHEAEGGLEEVTTPGAEDTAAVAAAAALKLPTSGARPSATISALSSPLQCTLAAADTTGTL